jgi:hypothetical protein
MLPIAFGLEVLVWMLIPRDNGRYSLTGVIDAALISPSILAVLLLWRYQYYANRILRIVTIGLLSISCAFYLVFTLFSFSVMVMPGTRVSMTYVAIILFILLILNIFLLYKLIPTTTKINH